MHDNRRPMIHQTRRSKWRRSATSEGGVWFGREEKGTDGAEREEREELEDDLEAYFY